MSVFLQMMAENGRFGKKKIANKIYHMPASPLCITFLTVLVSPQSIIFLSRNDGVPGHMFVPRDAALQQAAGQNAEDSRGHPEGHPGSHCHDG